MSRLDIISELLSTTDDNIHDYEWMQKRIYDFGVYPYGYNVENNPQGNFCDNGILQIVPEFVRFCICLADFKDIRSAIEIGVYKGASSYLIAAMLYRNNPDLKYYMVDIMDGLEGFKDYARILPIEKIIPCTSEYFKDMSFDFVFIDADHSYDASINDFYSIGKNARKYIFFHDIYAHEYDHLNGGTVRMWKEVCELCKDALKVTFSVFPNRWMGIGGVIRTKACEGILARPEKDKLIQKYREDQLEKREQDISLINKYVSEHKKLYLYGAGDYGKKAAAVFNNFKIPVTAYVISDGHVIPKKEGDNLPTLHLSDIFEDKDRCCFVIAVSFQYQQEILSNLEEQGYKNILIPQSDLFVGDQQKL